MLSLNIDMFSFEFKKGVIGKDDTIRISVTALPNGDKQSFTVEFSKLAKQPPSFSIKINEKIEKILIVFRKKSITDGDPIFCSTVIPTGEFPTCFDDDENMEIKLIDLLEPLQSMSDKNSIRKIVGRFYVRFALTHEIPDLSALISQSNASSNENEYRIFDLSFNNKNNASLYFNPLLAIN